MFMSIAICIPCLKYIETSKRMNDGVLRYNKLNKLA